MALILSIFDPEIGVFAAILEKLSDKCVVYRKMYISGWNDSDSYNEYSMNTMFGSVGLHGQWLPAGSLSSAGFMEQ